MRSNYAKPEFWDERYQKANTYYDWLTPYMGVADQQGLRDWMIENVDVESKILIVGCGISRMPIEMFEDGYENLTMIDRSQWAIRFQMENCKYPQDLPFHCMDARDMSVQKDGSGFKDQQFDYVIDKAVLDSVICGPNLCKKDELSVTEQMLTEVHRVLKPTGAYICVSHGQEIHRKKFLKNVALYQWKYKKHYVPKVNPKGPPKLPAKGPQGDDKKLYHFIYVCRKQMEEVFDSSDEEIINMFKPKFAFESEKLDGDFITLKEEQLPDDPTDESHPTTKSNVYDASQVQGPVKNFAEGNWAWKFKYIEPQTSKNIFQQFSDIQCISIEFIYQKWLVAKQLGYYETKRMRKGEFIKMPDDYEIFPIDAAFTVDLKHMIMFENKNPKNFFRIYRSQYNSRVKPTFNVLVEPGSPRNKQKFESALAALTDDKKVQKFKQPDTNGFYKQPYRPKSGGASREDLRNQYGKMFLKKNNFKQSSINQIVNGLILTNLDILKDQGVTYHNYHLDQAYTQYKSAFDKLLSMSDLGDPDKPIDINVLRFDPKHPIVQTVLYLYSLEPPFYRHMNRACREKDLTKIDKVGPFAATLGEIVRNQDPFREDKQQTDFKVFRGLTLPEDEIEGFKYILKDIKKAKDAFATGDNLNFKELLARSHAPVAQDIRELNQWFSDNSGENKIKEDSVRFFTAFTDAVGMAAVTNQVLEEQLEALFTGIVTALYDYSKLTNPEGNYSVDQVKKKFEGWKLKDFKKNFPGGEGAVFSTIIEVMNNFDISRYYKEIQPAIMSDLKNYFQHALDIPIEEQTGDKGRKSLLWKMIPWIKKVMEYLQMNENTVREQLIAQRKGKEFDIKEHTFHLEGFTSTSFERKVAEEFACKNDYPGKKSVIFEYTVKVDNNRYPGFQLNKPQFSAYPEENEFLLLDGADCILKEIKEEFVPSWGKQATVIEVEQINDWPHINPPGGKKGKGGGGKKKGKKK